MKIIHICSNYIGSNLYTHLFKNLNNDKINQIIYVPIRDNHFSEKYNKEYEVIYSDILNLFCRIFYFYKIQKIKKDILDKDICVDAKLIHAHTFFSDGGVAYLLNKQFKIPYVVAVRNTDIYTFLKYKKYLKHFGKSIITNADKIVFLSETYKQTFLSAMPYSIREDIEKKSVIIPNGIDEYWITNSKKQIKPLRDKIDLLFIGTIDKNKNLLFNINICKELLKRGYYCNLHIVGDGIEKQKCIQYVKKNNLHNHIFFYGKILDKSRLKSIMKKCNIFLLNSKFETFGLVYAEALSQGLSLLYTRGQGFDGQFKEGTVGYSIEYNNIQECISKILELLEIEQNSANIGLLISKFDWNIIAQKYEYIYYSLIGGDNNVI